MDGAIGVVHWTCFRAFNALVGAITSPARDFSQDITATDVEVQYDRYQLWSGNLGAGHAGAKYQLSLDYRLRESEFMRTQVLMAELLPQILTNTENGFNVEKSRFYSSSGP